MINNLLKKYFFGLIRTSARQDAKNVNDIVRRNTEAVMVDLGSGPRLHFKETLLKIVNKIKPKKVICCDIVKEFVEEAKNEGFNGKLVDLEKKLPFKSESVDIVFANQVIEHLYNIDNFLLEIRRILKKNGYLVIGTENLAAWDNIFSLFLGFQPFISTNLSVRGPIGNPLSLHKNDNIGFNIPQKLMCYLGHCKVLSYQGFVDLLKIHKFKICCVKGAGYYPFSGIIAEILTKIDPRHANRLQIKAMK